MLRTSGFWNRVVQSRSEITVSRVTDGLAAVLAVATGVPMGIETYPPDELPINSELLEHVKLNGLSLRTALTTLTDWIRATNGESSTA